ncbi:peroxiredoxin-like 2C [Watersipora subatra]|uniref:peroxiredoxin-like 2C n=1 Tax=Watersipora subatra TaxID=2589382 RepID=UPI00355BC5E0
METVEISKQKPVKSQSMGREGEEEGGESGLDWEAINEYIVETEYDADISFKRVYHDATTIVIFIRHFLCFTAKEYVEDLAKIPKQSLEDKRVRLVIIGCGETKFMKRFRRDTGYWAEFYTDRTRELYKLMGCKISPDLGNLAVSKHTKSSFITGVVRSAIRSTAFPGEHQGDLEQQGGAFILGPGEKCHFAHIDRNGSDHYPINKLLDMVGVPNVRFAKDSGVLTV